MDEWLLSTAHLRPPVLRLYGWLKPTVSLGRHEPWREVVDLKRLDVGGASLVRRPTGGRAVLHDREITYSVTAGLEGSASWSSRLDVTLARISGALCRGLERLGVPATFAPLAREMKRNSGHSLCFESTTRYELSSEGKKAVGSAQYRSERGFLQHGSIPMGPTLSALWSLGPRTQPPPPDPGLPAGLLACARFPLRELAGTLARGFEEEFQFRGLWAESDFVDEVAVAGLTARKYGAAEWTFRR